jgi:hypothetical protein
MSETPICDKHKYETDQGAEVVPFEIAQKLERKLKSAEKDSDRAEADEFWVIIEAAFADKDRQINKAYDYAANLLTGIVNEHYKPVEGFGPLPRPDVVGVLAQIDNAYTGVSDQLAESRAEIERLKATTIDASLLREKLAELAHNQWVGWMEYLFSKSKQVDGCVVIPAWANERWHRQVATRYADLSEEEKDSDRSEADKFLAVFNAELAEARAEIEALMFLVKNQRCCRNCGNHASWQFDICGFGENPQDENEGPHCRQNDLKRWRPMEYRRAKEAAERGE